VNVVKQVVPGSRCSAPTGSPPSPRTASPPGWSTGPRPTRS
jgi:hypothetical protein